jgi:alpha-1,2-mannosyltransferase
LTSLAPDRARPGTTALARLLPVLAVAVLATTSAAILAVAGDTLGYDFHAYHAAASRVLAGQPLYDLSYTVAGPYGLFLYPPTFLPLALPYALLPVGPATWAWIGTMLAAFAAGVAALPVSVRTRWLVVLLAGLSWPFVYGLKLGQVGPLLFLLFAVGWRALDRPRVLGLSAAAGAAIKVQPGIVLAWALATRRWGAVLAGGLALAAVAACVTVVTGVGAWGDFLTLLGRVNDPISTPHNFTPGAVAFQMGLPHDAAAALQWASTALVLVAIGWAALRRPAVPSYLAVVVASQLLSPVLWDHYAMLLLVPVAWLLDRGHRWAAIIPLVTSVLLVGVTPPIAYPLAFGATLVALLVVDA